MLVVDSLGVLGVELTRESVFGRRLAWASCIERTPEDWLRRACDVGGTAYGHVRCREGLVAVDVDARSPGAAIVTFLEGILIPGDVGDLANNEFGFSEIPDNGGVVNVC